MFFIIIIKNSLFYQENDKKVFLITQNTLFLYWKTMVECTQT